MAKVTYQMDQKGTAPLLRTSDLRAVLRRRAETGADAARKEAGQRADRVQVRPTNTGSGQWSDRAAVNIHGPADTLDAAVAAVERGDRV